MIYPLKSFGIGRFSGAGSTLYCIHEIIGERLYVASGKWKSEVSSFTQNIFLAKKNFVIKLFTAIFRIGLKNHQKISACVCDPSNSLPYSSPYTVNAFTIWWTLDSKFVFSSELVVINIAELKNGKAASSPIAFR